MPVRITLRTSGRFSPFRELLKRLIESPDGDSLVLCSGYIWEEPEHNYSVLDDELLNTIKNGCSQGNVTTVAGKFEDPKWHYRYRTFVNRLKDAGLTVEAYVAPKRNWHAKIAIRLAGGIPIAAVIGSSNLTGPAYGQHRYKWNFEGDVLIWSSSRKLSRHFRRPFDQNIAYGDIQLVLDRHISQPNEEQQLRSIYEDIFHSDLVEFKTK